MPLICHIVTLIRQEDITLEIQETVLCIIEVQFQITNTATNIQFQGIGYSSLFEIVQTSFKLKNNDLMQQFGLGLGKYS